MNEKIIYMDHAATTPISEEVLEAMIPYLMENYGNASSLHPKGQISRQALDEARQTIASIIGAKPSEIYFTGGGSEADTWAFVGIAEAYADRGRHIITTKIEHHAILHACKYLEARGYEVTYLDVSENGQIRMKDLKDAIREDTILVSVMLANNEIGTIQHVWQASAIAKEHGALFHTDAVQAFGHFPIDVEDFGIDLLSASAHKINGPKGVGLLYIRNGVKIGSLIHGGQQERGKRGGTENIAGIVGFAKAAELAFSEMNVRKLNERGLRNHMIDRILTEIPYTALNGARTPRLSNNVNIRFRYVDGESLLLALAERGICASAGSACDSGSVQPSHVLLALGIPYEEAFGSIRFSLSHLNTMNEVNEVVDALKEIVSNLREESPEYLERIR